MDENDISIRELARRLAGPNATSKQIETRRTQITRWRSGKPQMSPASARRVAKALGLPHATFVTRRETQAGLEARVEAVERETVAMKADMGRIQAQLARLSRALRGAARAEGQ